MKATHLCSNIFLEIVQYLTLNDAIKAFSDRILPLLIANRTRLQLSDPSLSLIDLIRRKNHSTEILSLIMKTHAFWASTSLDWLIEFPNLISLTLLQCYHAGQISMYTEYLPHLIRLSLSNDNQFNFHIIIDVLKSLKVAIQRLEIHSYGAVCWHLFSNSSDRTYPQNDTIRFLLIDIGDGRVPSLNECSHEYQFCFFEECNQSRETIAEYSTSLFSNKSIESLEIIRCRSMANCIRCLSTIE